MQEPHKLHTTMHVFEAIESFYDDVMITPSEVLADILHGSVGVTVANVNAASGRSAQPSLAISWKTLSQLSCFLIHLKTGEQGTPRDTLWHNWSNTTIHCVSVVKKFSVKLKGWGPHA